MYIDILLFVAKADDDLLLNGHNWFQVHHPFPSVSLSTCLPVCLFLPLSLALNFSLLPIYMSVYLSIYIVNLSTYLLSFLLISRETPFDEKHKKKDMLRWWKKNIQNTRLLSQVWFSIRIINYTCPFLFSGFICLLPSSASIMLVHFIFQECKGGGGNIPYTWILNAQVKILSYS